MGIDSQTFTRLSVHQAVLRDDFCDYAVELRRELLDYARWKVFRLGERYAFQTGITTGHIQERFPELATCHRLESELRAAGHAVCELVGARPSAAVRVDFAGMAYGQDGELLTHTDEVGQRYVAWILYLTDPDDGEWTEHDGGQLVLTAAPGVRAEPGASATVFPRFNRFVAFRTTEQSWHEIRAIRRATTWSSARLCLAGWIDGRVRQES